MTTDWLDLLSKAWTAIGPLLGVGVGAWLTRNLEREREARAFLRSRLEAQHAAFAEFEAYCAKYVPSGRESYPAVEAIALSTRVSHAFGAPEFAAQLVMLLKKIPTWDLDADDEGIPPGVNEVPPALLSWIEDAKRQMRRLIGETEGDLGVPRRRVQPTLDVPSEWRAEFGAAPSVAALPEKKGEKEAGS